MTGASRFFNLFAFGHTTAPVKDGGKTPTVQLRLNGLQTIDDVQVVHHFGFSSSAPVNSKMVSVSVSGDRSRTVIIGSVEGATRRKDLVTNETVVFDGWGNEVHLSQAGITVKHGTLVTIDAPGCTVKAPNGLRVEGHIDCTGEVRANCDGQAVTLSQHTHAHGPHPDPAS